MKKITIIMCIFIGICLCIYPHIEFYSDDYLYMMSYGLRFDKSSDYDELEQEFCYDENYSYNKKRNISTSSFEYNGFLFFKWFKVKYVDGNVCENEFILTEEYINNFIEKADIVENNDNINLEILIEGKKAIVKNKRYPFNENYSYISYYLDGMLEEMFIYNYEDLLIIQVGLGDEGPKYKIGRAHV